MIAAACTTRPSWLGFSSLGSLGCVYLAYNQTEKSERKILNVRGTHTLSTGDATDVSRRRGGRANSEAGPLSGNYIQTCISPVSSFDRACFSLKRGRGRAAAGESEGRQRVYELQV